MCGRYIRRSDKQRITEHFRLHGEPPFPLPPDFNIAPTTFQPVIRLQRDTHEREALLMRWGIVPFTAKSLDEYKGISTINARAESIQSGIWKRLFERQRCLIPADGFYEWDTILPSRLSGPKSTKPRKKPMRFWLKNDPVFAFAGLWDAWRNPDTGEWLQSFAIITTEANDLLASIHTRMPVILHPRDYARWIDRSGDSPLPLDLLKPFDAAEMQAAEANPKVNNARNNGEELLDKPDDEPEEGQMLF
ncbi:SOS response-associated peptidase [Granulicella cerasi]|uniref:Abasic site processing protein n=1 Tax=Granulicella cerasi TaxID=741063 RepID=A0ABW1ZAZ9_9BACT|nr:SOS response-associated peptidase [Granulicella cerasi]